MIFNCYKTNFFLIIAYILYKIIFSDRIS